MPNTGNAPLPVNPLQPIGIGAPDAVKQYLYNTAILGDTPRFLQIGRYESHYLCNQYAHQTYDWYGLPADSMETVSHAVETPNGTEQGVVGFNIRQKRPTAPTNMGKTVVDRFTGLLFSDARRPEVLVENDPDTQDYYLAAIEQCQFWSKFAEARTMGGACGGVVMTAHLRNGRYAIETHKLQHVTVAWKDRQNFEVAAILIMFRFPVLEVVHNKRGEAELHRVDYIYRRVITENEDTVYIPLRYDPNLQLVWENPAYIQAHTVHGLGKFPGVWVQNLKKPDGDDGEPDCAGAWQMLDTIDRLIAQMNKGTVLNLDPTMILSIDRKFAGSAVQKGSDTSIIAGESGSAKYLEMTGTGNEAGMKLVAMLKQCVLDLVRCVLVDPEKVSGTATSAKAIELMFEPMIVKADELRVQYGTAAIRLLKVIDSLARKFDGVPVTLESVNEETGEKVVEEVQMVVDLPPRIEVDDLPTDAPPDADPARREVPRQLGPGGFIRLAWPRYFSPTEQDKQVAAQTLASLYTIDLIDQETAVIEACKIYGIRDHQAVLRKVRKQRQEKIDEAMAGLDFGNRGGLSASVVERAPAQLPAREIDGAPDETPVPAAGEGGKP